MKTDEIRSFELSELRAEDIEGKSMPRISGLAAPYNSPSQVIGPDSMKFREVILPGAFRSALDSKKDILALMQHDPSKTIGRRSRGTLQLSEAADGLRASIDPPDSSMGKDAVTGVKRGDYSGMSIRFNGAKSTWSRENGENVRTISDIGKLIEVSLTPCPVYEATTAEIRSAIEKLESDAKATPLRDAAERRLRLAEHPA